MDKDAKGSKRSGSKTRTKSGTPKRRRHKDKIALVEQVIQNLEKRLMNDELKATVGDLIRLVQLEKELHDDQPREIKVTWVEPRKVED